MTPIMVSALAIVLGAELPVAAGEDLAAAAARAAPGDVLRLGPGLHRGALGRLAGVRVEGAGAGVTVVRAPEGQDGAVAVGALALSGLTLRAGPQRTALKVLGGAATLDGVALEGGSCGAFVDEGSLTGREVWLGGQYGLLARRGVVSLTGVVARGSAAGLALLGGELTVRNGAVTGPGLEAGITVAGGRARLEQVIVRDPGPSGLAISGGEVEAQDLTVAGASGVDGFLGDCVQVRRGTLRLSASELVRCSGAAVETAHAEVHLDGVDAAGGEVGCLVLTDRTTADLQATLCTRHGPGLVVMGGSTVTGFGTHLRTDPAMVVECATGARVHLTGDPGLPRPCANLP
jgi:hypothetical protein